MHLSSCTAVSGIETTKWDAATRTASHRAHQGQFRQLTDVAETGYIRPTGQRVYLHAFNNCNTIAGHEQVFFAFNVNNTLVISRDAATWVPAYMPTEDDKPLTRF